TARSGTSATTSRRAPPRTHHASAPSCSRAVVEIGPRMRFSIAIVLTVLSYTWVLAPVAPRWTATLAAAIVVALALARAATASEWGIAGRPFLASLRAATAFTIAAGGTIALVGWLRGSWHSLPMTATEAAVLFGWTLGQQFALQIVFLREAQGAVGRRAGAAPAAVLVAALPLPHPFLTPAT